MMAIFNAPLDLLDHPKIAIDCSLDIIRNMKSLNIELQKEDLPPVAIGIGINTGIAVIGNMGSESRFDYTAIGDAVNTAARLESGTKEAGVDMLIGYNTAIKTDYKLELLEPLKVKGKDKPLEVYTWDLEADKQEAMKDVNRLRKTFANHDLDELALAKPGLLQGKVNKASNRVMDTLEKLSDPNQFNEKPSNN